MKRRFMAMLLCAVLCLSLVHVPAFAEEDYPELTLGVEADAVISEPDGSAVFKFVAPEDKEYAFFSRAEDWTDTYGYLYDADMNLLYENDDDDLDLNFRIVYALHAGDTYYLEVCFNSDDTGSFPVMVLPVPKVTALTAGDTSVRAETRGYYEEEDDGEEWFCYYDIEPGSISVTIEDEAVFSGTLWEVLDELSEAYGLSFSFSYYFKTAQSSENRFRPGGSYEAVITMGGKTANYRVRIVGDPIVTLEAEDVTIREGECGRTETAENGEEWFRYDCLGPNEIHVITEDGEDYSGDIWTVQQQLETAYGIPFDWECHFAEEQSCDNQFSGGNTYEVIAHLGDAETRYSLTILPNVIVKIEAGDVTIPENTHGHYEIGLNGGEWFCYDSAEPSEIAITAYDGREFSGALSEVLDEIASEYGEYYGYDIRFLEEQSSENPFIGGNSYTAEIRINDRTAAYQVTIEASRIQSLEAENTVAYEGNSGRYETDKDGQAFFCYDCVLPNVTLVTADGKTFSGEFWTVYYELLDDYGMEISWDAYYADIDQYEEHLRAGETYEAVLIVEGRKATYGISIKENPFISLTASDVTIHEETYGHFETAENGEEWFCYDYAEPDEICLTASDGREYSGNVGPVLDALKEAYGVYFRCEYNFLDEQSYENQLIAGEAYDAEIVIGSVKGSFRVTIQGDPIVSVEAGDITIEEGMHGETVTEDNGDEWFRYACVGTDFLRVMTNDGREFSGDIGSVQDEMYEAYGLWFGWDCHYAEEQSYENQFRPGQTYVVECSFGGVETTYRISIKEGIISSAEASDVTILEGTNGHYEQAENGERWYCYDAPWPERISLITDDGTEFSGDFFSVVSDLRDACGTWVWYSFYFLEEQSYEHPFTAGNSYTAVLEIENKRVNYQVHIAENPIASVTAEDTAVLVGNNGYYELSPNGEEWFCYYDAPPRSITVTMKDGEVLRGAYDEVEEELKEKYQMDTAVSFYYADMQDFDHQFTAGNRYKAYFSLNGMVTDYWVTVMESPVLSVQMQDLELCEGGSGIYKVTDGHEWFYYYCDFYHKSITVETVDGTFTGTYADVIEQLCETYGAEFRVYCHFLKEQSYEDPFVLGGSYDAELELGGQTAAYKVTIVPSPLVSVTAEDTAIMEYDDACGLYRTTDAGQRWFYYWCPEPKRITVRTADGKEYSGAYAEVQDELFELYDSFFMGSFKFTDEQSFENQYKAGNKYEIQTSFGKLKYHYWVSIIGESAEEEIRLSKNSLTIPVHGKETLTAAAVSGTAVPVVWHSNDESVAAVDQNGVVTALHYGKCTITASTESGAFSDSCEVQTLFWDVAGSPNKDDPNYQYYFNPVYWAAEKNITRGFDLEYFGVNMDCERQQFALFLYRLAGQPAPNAAVLKDLDKTFSDVKNLSASFRKAIAWGYDKGIVKGYSSGPNAGKFGNGLPITRREAMIMLWRYAGKPAALSKGIQLARSFTDVKGTYKETSDSFKAIAWAAGAGIANGYTKEGSLPPGSGLTLPCYGCDLSCLREQMITFLYRYAN